MLVADGIGDWFPWYTWVCLGALIVIIFAYKMYQKKMMS
jgi:hypothetical protein